MKFYATVYLLVIVIAFLMGGTSVRTAGWTWCPDCDDSIVLAGSSVSTLD